MPCYTAVSSWNSPLVPHEIVTSGHSESPAEVRLRVGGPAGNLLCVANFPANTGYAWTFIESLYAGVADALAPHGVRTYVAYPTIERAPNTLVASSAEAVQLGLDLGSLRSLRSLLRFVHERRIRAVYLSDRPVWHPAYALLRGAGAKWIVVHDHTSGERDVPQGLRRALKRLRIGAASALADRVIAVSNYVAWRKRNVDLVPQERLVRIWNSVVPPRTRPSRTILTDRLGRDANRQWVACACRAVAPKGVPHLLRAFSRVWECWSGSRPKPGLLYIGDGPDLAEWRTLAQALPAAEDIVFAGYREDAAELVGVADVAAAPSVWGEAFGLAAIEAMVYGVPVVASRIGGLTEIIRDGQTGLLVPPGDEAALALALQQLLLHPGQSRSMGRRAFTVVMELFSRERQLAELVTVIAQGLMVRASLP